MNLLNAKVTACDTFDVSKNGNSRVVFTVTLDIETFVAFSPIDSQLTNTIRNAHRQGFEVDVTLVERRNKWVAKDVRRSA
jgi:hypothetical protein